MTTKSDSTATASGGCAAAVVEEEEDEDELTPPRNLGGRVMERERERGESGWSGVGVLYNKD